MKTYKILAILALITSVSCSDDFLDKEPLSQKVIENFYQTPDDAFEGLVATYDVLQQDSYGHFWMISEIASDNAFGGGGVTDGFGHNYWDWFRNENNHNASAWTKYYKGIYRANVLIENLDGVQWKQDSLRAQYEAEARFLRAYFYFDLVRMFGNVPLITKSLKPEEFDQPQSSPEAVYAQMAQDLVFAIDNLPAIPYAAIKSSDYGRVTKWAAESLLGRVFLYYTGYYGKTEIEGVVTKSQALAYLEDVINNSGHNLVPNYKTLWRSSSWTTKDFVGEDNIETVFAIKYTFKGLGNWGLNSGNRLTKFIGVRGQNIYPYASGWGFLTVNPKLYNAYEEGDTRRETSIVNIAEEMEDYSSADQRQFTGYIPKKYAPTSDKVMKDGGEVIQPTVVTMGGNDQIDWFDDMMIIRFSDVLLMAAELRLEVGGDAQSLFDRVRDRAFGGSAPSIAVTKQAIMEERRLEFALEGLRYWDLLRQGVEVAKQNIDNESDVEELRVSFRPETKGLFAIPESQISLSNGQMTQNDGWN